MSAITDAALAACLLAAAMAPAEAADWPDVPAPEDSRSEWVSRHMIYNGVHMQAIRFTSTRAPAQVEAFYREQWGKELIRNTMGHKTILGHPQGRHYVTVDMEASGGGTEGTIGIVDMRAPAPGHPLGHGMPKPANSEVINDIRYLDTDSPARTVLMHNALSPRLNDDYYQRRLSAEGWRRDGAGDCAVTADSCAAQYARAESHIALTFTRVPDASGTMVMANRVGE